MEQVVGYPVNQAVKAVDFRNSISGKSKALRKDEGASEIEQPVGWIITCE